MTKLFALYDNASGTYDVPRTFVSGEVAKRAYIALLEQGNREITFVRWPENFSLFYLGDYDDVTAQITPLAAPELVFNLWALLPKQVVSEAA